MEEELRRILSCMRASDTIQEGEYYVVHTDHLDDLESAINNYFLAKRLRKHNISKIPITSDDEYRFNKKERIRKIEAKINEIIFELNNGGNV